MASSPPPAIRTPHGDHHALLAAQCIDSRVDESVPSQAMRATLNLVNYLKGGEDVIQANKW